MRNGIWILIACKLLTTLLAPELFIPDSKNSLVFFGGKIEGF